MVVDIKNLRKSMEEKLRPKTIALTGARLAGKNRTAKMFTKYHGIPVFDADVAFKFLLNYDEEIRADIKRFFGANSFHGSWLNSAYFDNDPKTKKLLEFAEEKVFEAFFKWKKKQKTKYVIFMFSGLFELMNMKNFHSIISVYAPIDVRQLRVQYNLGEDMDHILDGEYSAETKNVKADHIIHSYSGLNVENQVKVVHNKILKRLS